MYCQLGKVYDEQPIACFLLLFRINTPNCTQLCVPSLALLDDNKIIFMKPKGHRTYTSIDSTVLLLVGVEK